MAHQAAALHQPTAPRIDTSKLAHYPAHITPLLPLCHAAMVDKYIEAHAATHTIWELEGSAGEQVR